MGTQESVAEKEAGMKPEPNRLYCGGKMLSRSRSPLQPPKARKPLQRIGKVYQTVRVSGIESSKLREECYLRAKGFCELRLEGCGGFTPWKSGEMAHVRSRGAGGSDELDDPRTGKPQVKWSCPSCHRISHAYGPSGRKPVPKKM